MHRLRLHPLCFLLLLCLHGRAQETLRLQDAIALALEKNYDVQLARVSRSVAQENNSTGNAGMLPAVTVEGGYNRTAPDLQQQLADGRVIDRASATSENFSAAGRVTWTLFDGMGMFIRKSRLESESREAELVLRLQMENSVQQVIAAYFAVQLTEQRIRALQQLLRVDSIRVQLASVGLESGTGNKLDLLQARLDFNNHRSQRLQEEAALRTAQEQLNLLLGREPLLTFTTGDSLTLQPVRAESSTRTADTRLRLASQREQTAFQWLREAKAQRLPVLTFNAAYAFNETNNEAGFLLRNRNVGPGFGLQLQWHLFDGFRTSRAVKTAGFGYEQARLVQEQEIRLRQQAEAKLQRTYALQQELARTAELSHSFAHEILMVATGRLQSGLGTTLEITEAQRDFEEAAKYLFEARYQAKLTETEILKVTGQLITALP